MRNREVSKGVIIQSDQHNSPFFIPNNSIDKESLSPGIAEAWGWDAIVGETADTLAGVATHTTLTSAIATLVNGGSILVIKKDFTEDVDVSNNSIFIQGTGRTTNMTGSLTVSGDGCIVSKMKVGDNISISGDGNFLTELHYTGTFSDTGTGNDYRVVEEV